MRRGGEWREGGERQPHVPGEPEGRGRRSPREAKPRRHGRWRMRNPATTSAQEAAVHGFPHLTDAMLVDQDSSNPLVAVWGLPHANYSSFSARQKGRKNKQTGIMASAAAVHTVEKSPAPVSACRRTRASAWACSAGEREDLGGIIADGAPAPAFLRVGQVVP